MNTYTNRITRALKLDPSVYEEIENDKKAITQAMATVALASVAAGVGASVPIGAAGLFWGIFATFVGWLVWAGIVYVVGVKMLATSHTISGIGELLRVIGFSSAPGFFRILGVFQPFQAIIFLVTGIWMLAAMVVAVRQALDFTSTARAIGVCLIGWLIQALIIVLVAGANGFLVVSYSNPGL